MSSVFETLNAINVNDHTEKKGRLTYLAWAWAWGTLKKYYPKSYYTVYESANGWNYHTDGKTAWVKTGVTVVDGEQSLEAIEYLPVMDNSNKSIPLERITSFDVNKAIQRSLTKAIGRHGLGLYIYAGEDLPEGEAAAAQRPIYCSRCSKQITSVQKRDGSTWYADDIAAYSQGRFGGVFCPDCMTALQKAERSASSKQR